MRFQNSNPGKRPKYNLSEIERLAKLGTPLAQLASKFGISYGYLRSVSCHQKWGIPRIYGYKHRFRKGLLPSLPQKVPRVEPIAPQPLQQVTPALPAPSGPSNGWHRDFDQSGQPKSAPTSVSPKDTPLTHMGPGIHSDLNCHPTLSNS
jgi:hypothetical protein